MMNKHEAISMDETETMIAKPIAKRNSTFNCCYRFFCCPTEDDTADSHTESNIQTTCPLQASANEPPPRRVANHPEILHDYNPLHRHFVLEKYGHRFGGFL